MKILYVDDDQDARAVAWLLEKETGEKVLFTTNGMSALEIIKEENIDFLITDGSMPWMNGAQLAEAVRKFNSEIKIALISNDSLWQTAIKDIPNIVFFDKLELAVHSWKEIIDWLKEDS